MIYGCLQPRELWLNHELYIFFREALKHDQVTKELTMTLQDKQHEAATLAQVCMVAHVHVYIHVLISYDYLDFQLLEEKEQETIERKAK